MKYTGLCRKNKALKLMTRQVSLQRPRPMVLPGDLTQFFPGNMTFAFPVPISLLRIQGEPEVFSLSQAEGLYGEISSQIYSSLNGPFHFKGDLPGKALTLLSIDKIQSGDSPQALDLRPYLSEISTQILKVFMLQMEEKERIALQLHRPLVRSCHVHELYKQHLDNREILKDLFCRGKRVQLCKIGYRLLCQGQESTFLIILAFETKE